MMSKLAMTSLLGLGLVACSATDEPVTPDAGTPRRPDAGVDSMPEPPEPEPRSLTVKLGSESVDLLFDGYYARVVSGPTKTRLVFDPHFRNAFHIGALPGDTMAEKCAFLARHPALSYDEWGLFHIETEYEALATIVRDELKRRGWLRTDGLMSLDWSWGEVTPSFAWQPNAISPTVKVDPSKPGVPTVAKHGEDMVRNAFSKGANAQFLLGFVCDVVNGTLKMTGTASDSDMAIELGITP